MLKRFSSLSGWILSDKGRWVRWGGWMLLFAAFTLMYGREIFKFRNHFGDNDWDSVMFYHQYWQISLSSFKQFPFWNPYLAGGISFLARPDMSFFPFPLLFVSAFGVVAGLKFMALFYIFLAMAGMFCLCRYLGIRALPAAIAAVIFSMSGCFSSRIILGHFGWLSAAYLPWVFLFYLKGLKRIRYLFVCALFLSLIVFEGSYIFAFTAVFLGFFSFMFSLQQKTFRPVLGAGVALLLCLLLSGPKLFPMIELMNEFPRLTGPGKGLPLKYLGQIFLDRRSDPEFAFRFIRPLGWWEFGSYIGIVPVILFFLSFKLVRERWPFILTAVFLGLIGLGNFSPISPWALLHHFSVFSNMQNAARIFIVFVFMVAILCGLCLNSFNPKSRKGVYFRNAVMIGLLIFIALDLIVVNGRALKRAFVSASIVKNPVFKQKKFLQLEMPEKYNHVYGGMTSLFSQILESRGIVNGYEAIPVERNAVGYGKPGYRGEFYLLTLGGLVRQTYWSPNKLVFDYTISRPETLVINQNYDRNWKASPPSVVKPYKGLISVELNPQIRTITLYYLPDSFLIGVGTFLMAVCAAGILILKKVEWRPCD